MHPAENGGTSRLPSPEKRVVSFVTGVLAATEKRRTMGASRIGCFPGVRRTGVDCAHHDDAPKAMKHSPGLLPENVSLKYCDSVSSFPCSLRTPNRKRLYPRQANSIAPTHSSVVRRHGRRQLAA